MDYRKVAIAVIFTLSGVVHAGYAQLAAPERFIGTPGNYKYAVSANDLRFGKTVVQSGALKLPIPGSMVTMPASYRFAANAPRIAAQALFLHPGIRTAVGIATWLGVASIIWDAASNQWVKITEGNQTKYALNLDGFKDIWFTSKEAACSNGAANGPAAPGSDFRIVSNGGYCEVYFVNKTSGMEYNQFSTNFLTLEIADASTKPLTKEEFEDSLAPTPFPETVPFELPFPTHLPVEQPVVNPSPGSDPVPSPLFVPTGDPVPNPAFDPLASPSPSNQPWIQPGVRVTPRPLPDQPFRVDLSPVDRPQTGPDPLPDIDPEPKPDDKPKDEDQKSLCEKHPDIVACQKLGTLSPEVLQKKTVPLTITKEDGFGPATGACPAPKTFVIMGKPMAFRWDLLCDFASQIRPLLVGFAYLSAALAFMGLSRKD